MARHSYTACLIARVRLASSLLLWDDPHQTSELLIFAPGSLRAARTHAGSRWRPNGASTRRRCSRLMRREPKTERRCQLIPISDDLCSPCSRLIAVPALQAAPLFAISLPCTRLRLWGFMGGSNADDHEAASDEMGEHLATRSAGTPPRAKRRTPLYSGEMFKLPSTCRC